MLPDNKMTHEVSEYAPLALLSWVERHAKAIECSADWKQLAYGASSKAAVDSSLVTEEYEALVTAAVFIYDRLSAVCPDSSDAEAAAEDAMGWRKVMINRLGISIGHPLREPAILEEWFFRRLNMSLDEALFMSQNVLTLPSEDFLRLSSLKDRLRLMRAVRHQEVFRRRDELSRWYALLDQAVRESPSA